MPRDWEEANAERLENTSALITAVSFSVGMWFKVENDPGEAYLFGIYDSGSVDNYHAISIAAADTLRAGSISTGLAVVQAVTANTFTAGAWNSVVGTFGPTAGTDRSICLNGGTRATQATNRTPAGLDRYVVGCRYQAGAPDLFFDGLIAHLAVWDAQLSVGEEQAFCRGVHPFSIRPQNLQHYWPLWGAESPEPDFAKGRRPLTLVNAPAAGLGNPWIVPVGAGWHDDEYAAEAAHAFTPRIIHHVT